VVDHLHHIDIRHADLLTPLVLAWVLSFYLGYRFGKGAVLVIAAGVFVAAIVDPAFGAVALLWAVFAAIGHEYRRR
jgi:hypothetical protein